MKRPAGVIAVDVGNTAVKLSLCSNDLAVETEAADAANPDWIHRSFALDRSQWCESIVDWVREQTRSEAVSEAWQWRIASVNQRASDPLCKQIERSFPESTRRLISYRDVPMPIDVESPAQLGIDRLLSAFAAHNRYTAPLIVIDAGSAVTVDLVNAAGAFAGGAILPGLTLQTNALTMGTAALPMIDWQNSDVVSIPGRNTVGAIRLGVLTSVTASIDRLIAYYSQRLDSQRLHSQRSSETTQPPVVILCGGDAAVISPHIQSKHVTHTHLVCQGLLDLT
ncbi:Bordetella pertussis Bvg accessory factor [Rhodopirellula maiorica SM1]|uniref:Type III pantothenate kinase n=1 Tax=Rhodopirellula maiorica SM1 TaxID=1265738 RepID=M5RS30_9BACT|nr:type III pantothenate kinase [Rhodopirellula maiorica]EMI18187.1 Bordetella pertussis Bvg accessory factor [Rhodopirellula maiorica SM1]